MKDYYLYLDPDDGILYVLKDGEVIAPVRTSASFDPDSLRIRNGFLEVKDFTSDKWEYICDENGHPASLLGPSGYSAVLDLSNDVVSVKVDSENQLDGNHVIETKVRYYLNDTHIGITESDIVISSADNYDITLKLIPGNGDSYILVTITIPTNTIINESKVVKIETTGNLHYATKNLTIIPISSTSSMHTLECLPSVIKRNEEGSLTRDNINIVVLKKESGKITRTILPEDYSLTVSQNGHDFPSSSVIYNEQADHPGYSFNFTNTNNYTDPITVSLYHNDDKVDETVHEFLIIPEIQEVTVEDIEKLQSALDEKKPSRYIELSPRDIVNLGHSDKTLSLVDKYSFKDGDWTIADVDLWIYLDGQFKKVLDIKFKLTAYQTATSLALKTNDKTIEGAINELFDLMLSSAGATYTASYKKGDQTVKYRKLSDQIGEYTTSGDVSYSASIEPYCEVCIFVSDQSPAVPSNPDASIYSLGENFTIQEGQTAYLVFAKKEYLSWWAASGDDSHTECQGDVTVTVSNFICKQAVSTFGLRSELVYIEVPLKSQIFIPLGSIKNKKVILVKPIFSSDYISINDVSAELIDLLHKEILLHPDQKLTIGGSYIEINCTDNTISPNLTSLIAVYDQSELLLAYLLENQQAHLSVSDMLYVTTEGEWVDA